MAVDDIKTYELIYTAAAMGDITEKADYIAAVLKEKRLAANWYQRLRATLLENLSTFPYKYPIYNHAPWNEKGYRIMTTSGDVILYTVDEENAAVYIHLVCTKGRDISAHLSAQ